MSTKSETRERAYIRQLCCLGLGMPAILPDLQKAFHKILNHNVNCYTWLDDNAIPVQTRMDVCLPEYMNLFYGEFQNLLATYDKDLPDVRIPVFTRFGKSTGNFMQIPKKFYDTDFYNLLLRPFRLHRLLEGVVKNGYQPVAIACFYRGPADPAYTKKEQELVNSLLPYLAHAEKAKADFDSIEYCENGTSGIVLARSDGSISHMSEGAREILYWSSLEDAPQGVQRRNWEENLGGRFKYLCRALTDVFEGKENTEIPAFTFEGRYGKVVCRAYWLDGVNTQKDNLIAINVEWKKPKQLLILENAKKLDLTSRQSELCLYVGLGLDKDQICNSLGVKYNTYKEYMSDIYQRLGINNRNDLLQKLLRPQSINAEFIPN